jgi:hypothetical protein
MNKLFDINNIKDDIIDFEDLDSGAVISSGEEAFSLGKVNEKVSSVFKDASWDKPIHYVSCGDWSMHELLQFILESIGPADVLLATWSMSEPAAVKLMAMLESRLITSLKGVIDFRTKNRHPAAFQLSQTLFSDLRLTSCHAKVTVVKNDTHLISIVGSANYTNNPRIEAGVISVAPKVGQFHAAWIQSLLQNAKPFENE